MTTTLEPHQVLRPDGNLASAMEAAVDEEFLLDALRWMLLSRAFDRRAIALQRQSRWGVYSPCLGQEASIVGSCLGLDPAKDWLVPQYRELAAYVHHGYPLEVIAANGMGKSTQGRVPSHVKMLPTQVALAAQLQHATGLAWGLKLQKQDGIVMAYIGEGGSSEGDFHEALNLAGVLKAPVVFFMQNNQWAISTPRRLQSAAPNFAARAAGYGFAGVLVDGNDVLAVYAVAVEAIQRARSGGGPTLIEAQTYRLSFHNTTDDPSAYVDPKDLEEARGRDPIKRVQIYLESLGLWDQKREKDMLEQVTAEVDAAIQAASAFQAPTPMELFENVYERPPERFLRQRGALLD